MKDGRLEKIAHSFKILHHAYLLEGDYENTLPHVRSSLKTLFSLSMQGNPDYQEMRFKNFVIDDARGLKARAEIAPLSGGRKFFVLSLESMTHEAQNALLKLFEEPTDRTHFILIVPNISFLLPTLRSRFSSVQGDVLKKAKSEEAKIFLGLSKAKRLEKVKALVEAINKEEKTREDAFRFLSSLEEEARGFFLEKKEPRVGFFLSELLLAKRDLYSRSPSVKLLLEHCALVAPCL